MTIFAGGAATTILGGALIAVGALGGPSAFKANDTNANVAATPAAAATATPRPGLITQANVQSAITAARDGAYIRLQPGTYSRLFVNGRQFRSPVTIDASAATITGGVQISNSSGIVLIGGNISNTPSTPGVAIRTSTNIRVMRANVSNAVSGISMYRSQNITVESSNLTRLYADGIQVVESQNVMIRNNRCSNFMANASTHNGATQLHPDCIQAWSQPTSPPVANVTVTGNTINGFMQGVFFGNNVINGQDWGGFDNITISNNNVTVSAYNGIYINGARGARITGNTVATVPGATMRETGRPVTAWIYAEGRNVLACGNRVVAVPTGTGTRPCPASSNTSL